MRAIAYGSVLIGHVAEVFSGASKIKLVSYPGEETNLFIENGKISAIGLGLGGGNIGENSQLYQNKFRRQNKHGRNFPLFVGNGG